MRNMAARITIMGAGPGGYVAAIRAARLGAEVTVVENDNVGGTCLNWGCIPTKALKATAEAIAIARRLPEFGVTASGEITPDVRAVMARKNKIVETLVEGIRKAFKSYHIELLEGTGTVQASDRVTVEGKDGRITEVLGDRLILATGSKPLDFPSFPFDGKKIISSNEALLLDSIPEEIIIIGGGVIGSEFAFIFKELGAKVTIVEALDRIIGLPSIDHDMSVTLQREMKKNKIKIHLNRTVTKTETMRDGKVGVTLGPSPFLAEVKEKDREPLELTADLVLACVGREINTKGLGLQKIGLELHPKGWIPVNEKMETNIPNVYAIGDVLGPEKIMLAHVASAEALVAAENCLGGNRTMNYDVVPAGIFTFPEVANVGLTEAQARERGIEYEADTALFRELGKAQAMGDIAGQVKIVSEARTGKILGVHIIGPHATDLIAEATLAMRLGATTEDLASTIHVHPSLSEAILEAASAAQDRSLHLPTRK